MEYGILFFLGLLIAWPRRSSALGPELAWVGPVLPELRADAAHWGIPVGFAIGWIEVESGGDPQAISSIGERGYFQVGAAEAQDAQIPGFDAITNTVSNSLEAGFRLASYYAQQVKSWGFPAVGTDYYWRMVKMCHAVGSGSAHSLLLQAGWHALTWSGLESWARQQGRDDQHFANTDRVMAIASQF